MTPELDATLDAALATLAAAGLDASGDLATIAQLTITPPVSLRPGLVEPLKTGTDFDSAARSVKAAWASCGSQSSECCIARSR
ncbi:MAG: hypothetical protein H6721_18450 [Sandaracinus sp.]|nr:hypothetical protein [Sandaracinus sp.]